MFAFGLPSLNLVKHDTVINYLCHTRALCFSFLSLSLVFLFSHDLHSSSFALVASSSVRFLFWSGSFLSPADEKYFAYEVASLWFWLTADCFGIQKKQILRSYCFSQSENMNTSVFPARDFKLWSHMHLGRLSARYILLPLKNVRQHLRLHENSFIEIYGPDG